MPLFALPLPNNSAAPLPRPSFAPNPIPRRKRNHASLDSPDENSSPEPESDYTHASTNPLSLTPDEIVQYRLAGLEITDDLPSQGIHAVKGFPHRALPIVSAEKESRTRDKGEDKERDQEDEYDTGTGSWEESIEQKRNGPGLHLRHLSVLTTILHRCLLAGDIPRATRAWAILIREQFWGQPINIKGSGYWAIGAELLIRSGEHGRRTDEDSEEYDNEQRQGEEGEDRRWGSAEGWEKARAYYEQLILQYPYRRQFQYNTSAIDFWPAMLGCEIYGVQWEQKEQLKKLEKEGRDNMDEDEMGSSEESEAPLDTEEDMELASQRRIDRRMGRIEEKSRWAKEEIRQRTLGAAGAIAARMDTLMSNHPYMDSRNLLRLRAMLAIYIGDLSVPAAPIKDDELEKGRSLRSGGNDSQQTLLQRQRQADYRKGKEIRREQRAIAKRLLNKILNKGGWVGDVNRLYLEEDDEEAHDHRF